MAALDRAVALAQVDADAVPVAQHLDLDVTRLLDELLEIQLGGAEGGAALRTGTWRRRAPAISRSRTMRIPRPPPPAAALTMTG